MKIFLLIIFVFTLKLSAEPIILIQPEVINFGIIEKTDPLGSVPVKLINKEDKLYVIRKIEIVDNIANSISYDLSIPSEIRPESNIIFNVYIDPSALPLGEFSANMYIFIDGSQDTIFAKIKASIKEKQAQKLEAILMIPEINMNIGDEGNIPVILLSLNTNIDQLSLVSGTISYNSTIIVPNNSPNDLIIKGERFTEFESELPVELKPGDTIAVIPILAALGNATATDINLSEVIFYSNKEPVEGEISFVNGKVSLNNIFYQNGIPRLVSEVSQSLVIYPPTNPVEEDFTLTIAYSNEVSLEIYTIDGIKITDYSSSLPYHQSLSDETILIRRSDFPVLGSYIIRLASSEDIVSKMIIVK